MLTLQDSSFEGWPSYLWSELGIDWHRVPIVMLSAVLIYVAFLVLIRIFGARVLTVTNSFDALIVIMLGSVAGRVVIGHPPTVATGIVGLFTLIVLEAIFGAIERTWRASRLIGSRPVLVFAHGVALPAACKKTHTSPADLHSAMRSAGVAHPDEVACIVLEPHGGYSVIKTGAPIDPELFANVVGAKEHLSL